MKKTIKPLVLALFAVIVVCAQSVFAAPPTFTFTFWEEGHTYTVVGPIMSFGTAIYLDDPEGGTFNCSEFITYTDVDTNILYTNISIVENKLITSNVSSGNAFYISFENFQDVNDVQPYAIYISCTDGVDTISTSPTNIIVRGQFIYTESDLPKSVISTLTKTIVVLIVFVPIIIIVGLIVWGKKYVNQKF